MEGEELRQNDYEVDPDYAWNARKATMVVREVAPLDPKTPKPEGHTRFVCISDTHSRHGRIKSIPSGDVLIHAGDFSNVGEPKDVKIFSDFLGTLPHTHKIVIAGNHDLTFDAQSYPETWKRFRHQKQYDVVATKASLKNCTYLEDQEVNVLGFRIYGSPWQPEFCDWAFNLRRGKECQEKWDMIPDGIDILITHGPPLGHGDLCVGNNRAGCVNLLDEVEKRLKVKYHIFGHIHEGYGITTNGVTMFVNASTCNYNYNPCNPPIVFDLPNPTSQ